MNVRLVLVLGEKWESLWRDTPARFDGEHCSGHHFSRVLMRIAVNRLFERPPTIRLDPGRPPVFTGWKFRAPRNLDVVWDA